MLVQVIPLLHYFSSQNKVIYVHIDEEKHDDNLKEKKEGKECLSLDLASSVKQPIKSQFFLSIGQYYASPLLEFLTPPPDCC